MRSGKQQTRTYGRYPTMSLAEARKAHVEARDEPVARRATLTFANVMRQWLNIKLPGLSNPKHQTQVVGTLERFVLPIIGAMPINAGPRTKLVEVVQAVQAGGQIETAHRVAGRITMVFNYAQDTGLIEHHAAAGLTRVLQSRKVRQPMVSIPPGETGALMRAIEDYDEPITRLRNVPHVLARSEAREKMYRYDDSQPLFLEHAHDFSRRTLAPSAESFSSRCS